MSLRLEFDQLGEPAEVLRLADGPVPEPGHLEVVVRMTARPINPSDLVYIRGRYGVKPELPAVPGFEGAGVVEAVGSGVVRYKIGDRVVPMFAPGTWQQHLCCMVGTLVPVPDKVDDWSAAQLVVNPFTAYVMLREVLQVDVLRREETMPRSQANRWLVQTAAGSALGRQIIELGQAWDFPTINIVRRPAQVDELRAFGAEHVVCSSTESIRDRIKELTGGQGAWAAIDAVGGEVGSEVARSLRVGASMLVLAGLSGEPLTIGAGTLLFKQLNLRGFWLHHWKSSFDATSEKVEAIAKELFELMAAGKLAMPVEAVYDLEEFQAALAHAAQQGKTGKVLLTG